MSVLNEILDPAISHKDMVRNIGRIGMKVRRHRCLPRLAGWLEGGLHAAATPALSPSRHAASLPAGDLAAD